MTPPSRVVAVEIRACRGPRPWELVAVRADGTRESMWTEETKADAERVRLQVLRIYEDAYRPI